MNMSLINVTMKNIKYIPLLLSIIILSSCGGEEQEFDANGHFETTEIKVYAENPGRLVFFSPETSQTSSIIIFSELVSIASARVRI